MATIIVPAAAGSGGGILWTLAAFAALVIGSGLHVMRRAQRLGQRGLRSR